MLRKFKNSTDVGFFNPISLVLHDYIPFFLSETVEEPKKRDISKLRFFTGNRIILAAYATNGDILLWELINMVFGKEWGHWENVEIIRNNQSEPLECAFPDNGEDFISAYADGTILIRPFSTSSASRKIATIPGIDAGVFRWDDLKCDDSLKQMLMGYQHKDS